MEKTESSKFSFLLSNIPDLNAELAIAGIGGSESMYKKVLDKVMSLLPANVEEMDKFLHEDEDLGAFAIKVHGIKGSLRQIGCPRLADLAYALETESKAGNREYCDRHYVGFREELLHFYEQVDSIMRTGENTAENGESAPGDINEYLDVLTQVKDAAAGYDSSAAISSLSPLLKINFGGNADILLKKAAKEFESYRPRKGLVCITELLAECQQLAQQREREDVI